VTETAIHRPGAQRMGFFTDTTTCIGCKACEVACKQWNDLPSDGGELVKGGSYDHTRELNASTWRHVRFVELADSATKPVDFAHDDVDLVAAAEAYQQPFNGFGDWVFMSDVCKHCTNAGCLDACPTGALIRTEFGSVVLQPDVCNGCGYCVPACPFGVVARRDDDGRAFKCTLCYDRLQGQLEPACAKACPTDSIQFGPLDELRARAADRVAALQARGHRARLYGESRDAQPGTGGLHAFFLLDDEPEVYNLPPAPVVPTFGAGKSWLAAAAGALGLTMLAVGSALVARGRR
jgi:formate dehydrogenase iron-sulfur subunit